MIFPRAIVAQFATLSALAGGAIFLSGCGGGASAAPSIPQTNSNLNRIAFSSNRDGDFEIYTMNPDGSDVQRVTTAAGDDTKPAWSRDKTKLAFVSGRDGNAEIYVVNVVNGKASGIARRVTNNVAIDRAPSWNPAGTELVFESDRDKEAESESALYIVNAGTLVVRRLTQRPGQRDRNPAWSPKGDLIAFESRPADISNAPSGAPTFVFTIEANGEDVKELTGGNDPAWHPDGSKLVFWRSLPSIWILDVGSGAETRVTSEGDYREPTYSPDGQRIAAVKGVLINNPEQFLDIKEIYTFDTQGDDMRPLTDDVFTDLSPAW